MAITLERRTERPVGREFAILREPDWRAALGAGLIAAAVTIVLQIILSLIAGNAFWAPLRMVTAIVTPWGSLPYPTDYNWLVVWGGIFLSLVLGVGYSCILAEFVCYQNKAAAVAMGLLFGLFLYWINFYGLAPMFPSVVQYRAWPNWVSHIVFGGLLAWAYKSLEPVFEPALSRRPEARTPAEA